MTPITQSAEWNALRDHYGQTQVVFDEDAGDARDVARHLHAETVVTVEGAVRRRRRRAARC